MKKINVSSSIAYFHYKYQEILTGRTLNSLDKHQVFIQQAERDLCRAVM